jgi:hypothetical protein
MSYILFIFWNKAHCNTQFILNYYIEIIQINQVKKLSKPYLHLLLWGLSCVLQCRSTWYWVDSLRWCYVMQSRLTSVVFTSFCRIKNYIFFPIVIYRSIVSLCFHTHTHTHTHINILLQNSYGFLPSYKSSTSITSPTDPNVCPFSRKRWANLALVLQFFKEWNYSLYLL